jgi:hypothetical protein
MTTTVDGTSDRSWWVAKFAPLLVGNLRRFLRNKCLSETPRADQSWLVWSVQTEAKYSGL